jgi:two-component system, cell cycle sensor histidine kinase and response regulator CckA
LREKEQQLWRAQKLESLGVLAGGIAHDFNNILAGIMGYADLIRLRLAPSEPARQDLDVIKKAVQRAADLTRQLLAYAGRGKMVVEAVDLSRVVEDARKMLDVTLSKKAVVNYGLASGLPTIQADISQIHQILLNLVINASESLGDRTGVITIATETVPWSVACSAGLPEEDESSPRPYVCLTVSDTGCGMDEDILGRIFDPFFTTKFAGRGLGLAAVHGIVRAHHGAIRVRSTLGSGTTFQVYFPASALSTEAARDESAVPPWCGTGCVLVVDDEILVRQSAQRMIEEAGFSVLTAHDGEDAVRVYREYVDKITCVLLDLTMPKMDGAETFGELRRLHPGVRVILSSGCGEEWAMARIAGLGWAGFIQKPYQYAEIVSRLREVCAMPVQGPPGGAAS